MMLGTQYLNAFLVQVTDSYGNPIAGATVQYTPENPGANRLRLSPGLGPDGRFFSGFTTNAEGMHVLGVEAPMERVAFTTGEQVFISELVPSFDEFQSREASGLAPPYQLRARVAGAGIQNPISALLQIDVDMGPQIVVPTDVTDPNDRRLLGLPAIVDLDDLSTVQRIIGSARKGTANFQPVHLLRRRAWPDPLTEQNCDLRNIAFEPAVGTSARMAYSLKHSTDAADQRSNVSFSISRNDRYDEANYPELEPPTLSRRSSLEPVDPGDASRFATRFEVGDVGGLLTLQATAPFLEVPIPFGRWIGGACDESEGMTLEVGDNDNDFASGITLRTIPLVIRTEIEDDRSGVDLRTVVLEMNGRTYLDLSHLPWVQPLFPERIDVIVDGVALAAITQDMAELLRPNSVVVEYYPHAKRILPANTVTAAPVGDLGGNYQNVETILQFSDEVLNE